MKKARKHTLKKHKLPSIPIWLKRTVKWSWVSFATIIVILAISLTVFRALTPWAAQYKGSLEARLSSMFGAPVSIQQMKTSWYWFEPVLKLDGVEVEEKDSVLHVQELLVGIDLLRSLWHWRIQPGVLFVEDAAVSLKQVDGHWQLDGAVVPQSTKPSLSATEYSTALGWLLAHQKIVMKRVSLTLHWQDGRVTPIKPLSLIASNHGGRYRVKGHASLTGKHPSALSLLADLDMPAGFSSDVRGQVYVALEQIDFSDWKTFFSTKPYRIEKGQGEIEVWLDMRHAQIVSGQAVLRLRDLVWASDHLANKESQPKTRVKKIERFNANLAWEENPDGWRLIADQVRLKANQTTWPENAVAVTYLRETDEYKLFFKNLLLEPVESLFKDELHALDTWDKLLPTGQLSNTQIGFKLGRPNYVLTRFSHLSWQATDKIPAVTHLSGALAWEPNEGRLELDGEAVQVKFKNKPVLDLELVNAAFVWKFLSHGLRVSLDRGIIKHPNGLFSGRGVLDGASADSSGTLQTDIAYALRDANFWMAYLPEEGLKPKLKSWLTEDITRIEQASGRIKIQGPLSHFPFDTHPGEFSVTGSMSGVDLRFNSEWPLTKDISATLKLDKRTLTAEITDADFNGVALESGELTVTDLGLDKEVMTVDGRLSAPAEDMLNYIATSPLHKRLSKLDVLQLKKPAKLLLNVKFPFYSTPEGLTVKGQVDFAENTLNFKEVPPKLMLLGVSGTLFFDTHGVLDSHLNAKLFEEPITIWVRSYHNNDAHLAIDIKGHLSVVGLKDALDLPVLNFARGRAPLHGKVKITDEPSDLDLVHVTSSLEGLEINLPAPFGKKRGEIAPLKVDTYFNVTRGIRLKVDYDKRIETDLWFDGRPPNLKLARGEVTIGTGKAVLRDLPGATISGRFKSLNLADWEPVFTELGKIKTQGTKTPSWLEGFRAVSLTIEDVELLKQRYHNVELYGQQMPDHVWGIVMKEVDVSADLKYSPKQNLLTGSISSLTFPAFKPTSMPTTSTVEESQLEKVTYKAEQVPNLNLKVGALQIGDVNAGELSIKGEKSGSHAWHLDKGVLKTEFYDVTMSGTWYDKPKSMTDVNARVQISDLEKTLERWHGTPVVEARGGDIQIDVAWDESPADFSLKTVTGKMHIAFKDGRITHLNPETEKKIGLGKLLSILSLQTIPRRLKLDFSDLAKPGYSFDRFDGNFILAHGILATEDSAIDGPVARASMKGSLDIDKQLYDLSLHITPHITASLPIVATIAGGPVAGVATWVASKLINQGMEKISGYTYDVSGPWQEPVVQQVHIYKKQPSQHN